VNATDDKRLRWRQFSIGELRLLRDALLVLRHPAVATREQLSAELVEALRRREQSSTAELVSTDELPRTVNGWRRPSGYRKRTPTIVEQRSQEIAERRHNPPTNER
jgi:hypothetical protein